uniref:LNR domain-containing protein n=1 Tax=Vitrella brassicaformis TaxID=1169539 RepID=A0A7S1K0Q0_9ALVE|mmetsp:Transcript_32322/g.80045  ORF Transcript_32322/g.80045 Transcript_32322/m.80045 type:complete len:258 (+) Transcript_32322:218-991(+)
MRCRRRVTVCVVRRTTGRMASVTLSVTTMRVASTEETAQGASCNDVSPYCLWNETCVNGRCESLCLGTECSQPNHECHVHREEGAEKGVPKCVEKGAEMPSTCHGVCRERGYWKDEECDLECYSYACEFDGGDCDPGLYCNDLSPYCLWNETCVNHDGTSFGRCESLCLDHECPQDHDCQVHREEGAEKGVPQCVEKDPSVTTQPPPTPVSRRATDACIPTYLHRTAIINSSIEASASRSVRSACVCAGVPHTHADS